MVEVTITEQIGITSLETSGPKRQNQDPEMSDLFDIGNDVDVRRSRIQANVKYKLPFHIWQLILKIDLNLIVMLKRRINLNVVF